MLFPMSETFNKSQLSEFFYVSSGCIYLKLSINSAGMKSSCACWDFRVCSSLELGMKLLNHYMVDKLRGNSVTGSEKQPLRRCSF